jgi:hypothetical protein
MREKRTHYTRDGKQVKFDYFTVRPDHQYGGFVVHGFGEYGRHSVLAGQSMKASVGCFDTKAEALAMYPEADDGHDMLDPQVSLNHLPGENDFVAGGAYPDDWDDGY